MKRDKELELLEASIALVRNKQRPQDGEETLAPTSDYVDPEHFERERNRIHRRGLNVVTVSSAIAKPGDFITAEVMGTPTLIARGDDGQLRAFINVCRHRGATIELRDQGHCKRFVCPYHAWTYDLDGSLNRVRHPEGFPTLQTQDHGLVELACTEAAGLVWVCPTPGLTPEPLPAALVEELEVVIGPDPTVYASTSKVWHANWKLLVEGGIESYHFKVAHRNTIASYFADTASTWERIGSHMRMVLPKQSVAELEALPREQWNIREHTHVTYTLHPNATILLQKSHFDLIMMTPLSPDQTQVDLLTVGRKSGDAERDAKAKQYLSQNHAFSVLTLDEDFRIGEQIQRGLRTGANTHFRFGRYEGALSDWRRRMNALLE